MKREDRIWLLLARKLSGEATEEELKELALYQQEHPDNTYSLQMLADLWQTEHKPEDTPAEAFDRHLFRMATKNADTAVPRSVNESGHPPTRLDWKDLARNYLKTSWRSLQRNKSFSAINISGLAIGIASSIILLLWIHNELTFDQFHKNKDRVYQVYQRGMYDGKIECWGNSALPLGPAIKKDDDREVEEVVRTNWVGAFVFSVGGQHVSSQGYLTDPGFFKLFTFTFLKGDPATALSGPRSLVITARLAKRLFGQADPLGQTVRIDSNANFVVSAVLKDLPPNTDLNFEYLVPWSYMKEVHWDSPDWGKSYINTFLLLRQGVAKADADKSLRLVIPRNTPNVKTEVFLHPMSQWHLYGNFTNGKVDSANVNFVRMLALIAIFILFIACINYMNLSTARSIRRAREVGIRKVAGAGRGSLIGRFLGESLMIAFFAGIVALMLVALTLPWFDSLIDKRLSIPYANPWFWLTGLGFILFTGLVAGSYPAFYLSAFRPIYILRGHFKNMHALITPRRVLVVFQFTFAIALIICTAVIYHQLNYVLNRDPGYDIHDLTFVYVKGDIGKNYGHIRQELLDNRVVTSITRTNSPITDIWTASDTYRWPGVDSTLRTEFIEYSTDRNFISTMGLHLLAGRDLDIEKYPADSSSILLSETAAQMMGLKEPVGQLISNDAGQFHVVGVIKDFVTGSLFNRILPIVVKGRSASFGAITFRMTNRNDVARLKAILTKYNPNYPFDYHYLDKFNVAKYEGEEHTGSLAAIFAGMAIFISCLGLFGLAAYMAECRLQEVGVRKVLGASVIRLAALLSKDFLILVLIAFAIASPLAWWAMSHLLQSLPYHAGISWWIFPLTGLLSLLIAAGTVGFQAIQAARISPVRVLRND
jgi:ABC-type antimicrobial peptide transport system permease subunit